MSQIEKIINDLESYLDGCKAQAFSNSKRIVVDKDFMDDILADLRIKAPQEVERFRKIIANKDDILADAKRQADAIIADANRQKVDILDRHEIMQQAYAEAEELLKQTQQRAKQILDDAVAQADSIHAGAISYTDELLKNVQTILAHTMQDTQSRFSSFYKQLETSYEVVTSNRKELSPQAQPGNEAAAGYDASSQPMLQEDYPLHIAIEED